MQLSLTKKKKKKIDNTDECCIAQQLKQITITVTKMTARSTVLSVSRIRIAWHSLLILFFFHYLTFQSLDNIYFEFITVFFSFFQRVGICNHNEPIEFRSRSPEKERQKYERFDFFGDVVSLLLITNQIKRIDFQQLCVFLSRVFTSFGVFRINYVEKKRRKKTEKNGTHKHSNTRAHTYSYLLSIDLIYLVKIRYW